MLTAVTVGTMAETKYGIKVGGVEITSANCNNVTGDNIKALDASLGAASVVYTPSTKTLRLKNVKISTTGGGDSNRAIYYTKNSSVTGLKIVLVGRNTFSTTGVSPVRIEKSATISSEEGSDGLVTSYIYGGSQDAVTVRNATTALSLVNANLTIESKSTCFEADGDYPALYIENSTISATCKQTNSGDDYAVKDYNKLTVMNSTVTLRGMTNVSKNLKDLALGKGEQDILTPGTGSGYGFYSKSDNVVTFHSYLNLNFTNCPYTPYAVKFQMSPKISAKFTDTNLRSVIAANTIDKDGDGYLNPKERLTLKTLDVHGKSISNLTGIELFEELTTLLCHDNSLQSIDMSKNTKLTTLVCSKNGMTSLNVSKNTALTSLVCDYNSLGTLNVSANTELTVLTCNNNSLTSLNLSSNTKLTKIYCNDNGLTSLDVSKNTALAHLYCQNNKLASLKASTNCTKLVRVECYGNQIKGSNMTTLVKSLPSVSGTIVVRDLELTDDNLIDPAQVKTAKDKGWSVKSKVQDMYVVEEGMYLVEINATNFPDTNFRNFLLNQTWGKDGILTDSELQGVTTINVQNKGITTLKGIGFFTKLAKLYCNGNSLQTLDLSKNTALTILWCHENSLQSLSLSQNTALENLHCYSNKLTALNVSNNTKLKMLGCYKNNISGAAMTTLVNSLPNRPDKDGVLRVSNSSAEGTDNVITMAQAQTAKGMGWSVRKFDGTNWLDYAGLGDTNLDGQINGTDRDNIVKTVMGQKPSGVHERECDLNVDQKVDAADVVEMVKILKTMNQ